MPFLRWLALLSLSVVSRRLLHLLLSGFRSMWSKRRPAGTGWVVHMHPCPLPSRLGAVAPRNSSFSLRRNEAALRQALGRRQWGGGIFSRLTHARLDALSRALALLVKSRGEVIDVTAVDGSRDEVAWLARAPRPRLGRRTLSFVRLFDRAGREPTQQERTAAGRQWLALRQALTVERLLT